MNCGLFGARADRRGLAALSENLRRNLPFAKTLVLDFEQHRPFRAEPGRFPGADVMGYDAVMAEPSWDWWLDGLDSVLLLETPYTPRIIEDARARGVKVLLLAMPEYLDPAVKPDVLLLPTSWLADRHPDAVVLPVPVEPIYPDPGHWILHPAGSPAMGDRNGTRLILDASRGVRRVLVRAQHPPDLPWHSAVVEVGDLPEPVDVFAGAVAVVIPRRYGGLSLPMQDAMGAGLPLLATDCEPYGSQLPPEARLPIRGWRTMHTSGGSIPVFDTDASDIALALNRVMRDDGLRSYLATASRAWADEHCWDALRPAWLDVL